MRLRLLAISLAVFTAAGAARAYAAVPLVAVPTSAHGWHPAPASRRAARRDLARGIRRGSPRPTGVQAVAARRRGATLRDDAFLLPSARAARRTVARWGGHRSTGLHGRIVLGRRTASVIWREGARVGLLILHERASRAVLRRAALQDARFADAALRTRAPSDSWQRVLASVSARGTLSRSTALAAFSLAYGPLPGGHAPRGRHAPIPSGTLAALWALSYAPRLPAAQRAAIDRRLGLAVPGARRASVPGSGGDPGFVPDAYYQQVATNWAAAYQSHLGRPLGLQLIVGRSPNLAAFADALPLDADGGSGDGPPVACRIRMGPTGAAASSQFQLLILAHEVFHCFQFALMGRTTWRPRPAWILEGLADWAALTVDPVPFEPAGAGGGGGNLKYYLETPWTPLFARSYDAVGFWGHLADFTGALWPRVSAILNAPNDEAAFKAADGTEDSVLSSWGSSAFRVPGPAAFTMHSPIEPPGFAQLKPEDLRSVWAHVVGAAPYTTSQYQILPLPRVPLIHVAIDGPARLLAGGTEYTDLSDAWFCVHGRDCRCPPDSASDVPPTLPLDEPAYLGVTGDPQIGTAGVVESDTLEQFCRPKHHPHPRPRPRPQPAPAGGLGCDTPCGSSNGDPHLETIAGYDYDFQAAGEFTAVKSTDDDLEIQERQEPFRSPDLTVDTAVAMRVAGDRVEIDAGRSPLVRVNGLATTLSAAPLPLPDGGTVAVQTGLVVVTWPDGSEVRAWGVGPWGVSYLFEPAPIRAAHLQGLLGGDATHLAGRDGHVYPASALEGTSGLPAKYHRFGESWRITPQTSLFTYPPGKSTASYTDRSVPGALRAPGSLPARVRAAAARACHESRVTRPAILRDCVLDVGATHERAFATAGATLQRTATTGPPAPQTRATRFETVCDADAPPDANGQIPVGTDAGIDITLESAGDPPGGLQTDGPILIHWPEDGVVDTADASSSDFHELDTPGVHTAYATFAGDADHDPTQSITCTWNVAG